MAGPIKAPDGTEPQSSVVASENRNLAKNDDAATPTLNKTQQTVNQTYNGLIKPKSNVLSDYASYTYQLTWYLLDTNQYNKLLEGGVKSSSTWQILVQGGGASNGNAPSNSNSVFGQNTLNLLATNSSSQGNMTGTRNKYFNLDYFIDDLEIETMVPLKGTGFIHSATSMSFNITEPYGVTLLDNLYAAVADTYRSLNGGKSVNYSMASYCLGIRFYGYDEQGNQIKTGRSAVSGNTNTTDPRAIVEKFYPFVIKNISFRMVGGMIRYKVECVPMGYFYNTGTDRGTVPFQLQLGGQTVKDVLIGGGSGSTTTNSRSSLPTVESSDGRASSPEPKTAPPGPAPSSEAVVSSANSTTG